MKIYENANDKHVRKVVLYEVGEDLAFDEAGTELLTKEEIVDTFLKGCVVENEGNYKTPTGVNVTDEDAELVFGSEGGSGNVYDLIINTTIDVDGGYFNWEYPDMDDVDALKNLLKNSGNVRAPKVLVRFSDFLGWISNVEAVCVSMELDERICIRVANPRCFGSQYELPWIYITLYTNDGDDDIVSDPRNA